MSMANVNSSFVMRTSCRTRLSTREALNMRASFSIRIRRMILTDFEALSIGSSDATEICPARVQMISSSCRVSRKGMT